MVTALIWKSHFTVTSKNSFAEQCSSSPVRLDTVVLFYCKGTSIEDFLDPSTPISPNLHFWPSNFRCFEVISDPQFPLKSEIINGHSLVSIISILWQPKLMVMKTENLKRILSHYGRYVREHPWMMITQRTQMREKDLGDLDFWKIGLLQQNCSSVLCIGRSIWIGNSK